MPDRHIIVEAVPDPQTNQGERDTVSNVAANLMQAAPTVGQRTPEFWLNAGNLATALSEKLIDSPPTDGTKIDQGLVLVHAVDPDNPRIYLPSTDGNLPTLQFPMTWDQASPNSRHYILLRFEEDV